MSRARLAIGTFGEIGFLDAEHGRVIARARHRDWDGRTRLVQVTAETRALAERALKMKLSTRSLFQPSTSVLTPDSLFSHLVDYWLEDMDQEGRLSTTTRQLYERNMRTLVVPAIGNLDSSVGGVISRYICIHLPGSVEGTLSMTTEGFACITMGRGQRSHMSAELTTAAR